MAIEFQEFIGRVADYIRKQLGEECSVSVRETLKNNGEIRKGLLIENGSSNISPCIYLEDYYRGLAEGEEALQEVLEEVMSTYEKTVTYKTFDTYILGDYGSIRGRLRGKLINTEKTGITF